MNPAKHASIKSALRRGAAALCAALAVSGAAPSSAPAPQGSAEPEIPSELAEALAALDNPELFWEPEILSDPEELEIPEALLDAMEETTGPIGPVQDLVLGYLDEHDIPSAKVGLAYRDLRSGEEFFLNSHTNYYCASLYKLALCMYFTEKAVEGERSFEDHYKGVRLDKLIEGCLVDSSNAFAYVLCMELKGYREAKAATASYYGMTEEEARADKQYISNSYITPQRMLECLQQLWDGPGRFPGIMDYLLRAEPEHYFRLNDPSWPVAQKYGYFTNYGVDISTAGVFLTNPPFLLVVMTHNVPDAEEHIAALGDLLGRYTQAASAAPEEDPGVLGDAGWGALMAAVPAVSGPEEEKNGD